MVTPNEYRQLKAFARIDGMRLGILWIISFACFIGNFSNPILGTVGMLLVLYTPFFVALRLKKFRDRIRDGYISFKRSLAYVIFVFFYGSLILATAQYIYLAFIDHGYIMMQYSKLFSTPEIKQMMRQMGNAKAMNDAMQALSSTRPIELVLNFLSIDITTGIILGFPIAAIMKRTQTINQIN
jgi:hypothetical protein